MFTVCHTEKQRSGLLFQHVLMHAQCCAVPACMHPGPCMQATSKDRQAENIGLGAGRDIRHYVFLRLCSHRAFKQQASELMHNTYLTH